LGYEIGHLYNIIMMHLQKVVLQVHLLSRSPRENFSSLSCIFPQSHEDSNMFSRSNSSQFSRVFPRICRKYSRFSPPDFSRAFLIWDRIFCKTSFFSSSFSLHPLLTNIAAGSKVTSETLMVPRPRLAPVDTCRPSLRQLRGGSSPAREITRIFPRGVFKISLDRNPIFAPTMENVPRCRWSSLASRQTFHSSEPCLWIIRPA